MSQQEPPKHHTTYHSDTEHTNTNLEDNTTSHHISLPPELWLLIASFVPPRSRKNLLAVNRLFFHMIMTDMYSQLSFISADPKVFVDKLRALGSSTNESTTSEFECIPDEESLSLASRVRVLTLWPSAVRDALNADGPKRGRSSNKDDPSKKRKGGSHNRSVSEFKFIQRSREYVQDLLGGSPPPSPKHDSDSIPSKDERLTLFLRAIPALSHISSLEINWYVDHGPPSFAWTFPHFSLIWAHIGPNLRHLTMDIQLFKLGDIIVKGSAGALPCLEELNLTVRNEVVIDGVRPGEEALTIMPYFINKLKLSLKTLRIKTIRHIQLSFFRLLDPLPHLRKLSLIMPLDRMHLQDPLAFRHFLHSNPCIEDLCVRYTRCCRDFAEDGFCEVGKHLLYDCVSIPALKALELGLSFPLLPPSAASSAGYSSVSPSIPLVSTISRISSSLTTLILKDRSLSLSEARSVFRSFHGSSRLKRLSMFAELLSPQLVDLVATSCPVLSVWEVDVQTVVENEDGPRKDDVDAFTQSLFTHAVDLDAEEWRYRTWTLSDISVMKWEFKVGHTYSYPCMKAIADVVPSVRSFAGKGGMEWPGREGAASGCSGEAPGEHYGGRETEKVFREEREIYGYKARSGGLSLDYGERGRPWDT